MFQVGPSLGFPIANGLLTGYSGHPDATVNTMYGRTGQISLDQGENFVWYTMSTYPGDSGAPVYYQRPGYPFWTIVGVHVTGVGPTVPGGNDGFQLRPGHDRRDRRRHPGVDGSGRRRIPVPAAVLTGTRRTRPSSAARRGRRATGGTCRGRRSARMPARRRSRSTLVGRGRVAAGFCRFLAVTVIACPRLARPPCFPGACGGITRGTRDTGASAHYRTPKPLDCPTDPASAHLSPRC
jgi:hypothetical protein